MVHGECDEGVEPPPDTTPMGDVSGWYLRKGRKRGLWGALCGSWLEDELIIINIRRGVGFDILGSGLWINDRSHA